MRYYASALAVLFMSSTFCAEKREKKSFVLSKTIGIAQGALSISCLASIGCIGYFIHCYDLNAGWTAKEGPSTLKRNAGTAALYASMASLLYTSWDLGYSAFKRLTESNKKNNHADEDYSADDAD